MNSFIITLIVFGPMVLGMLAIVSDPDLHTRKEVNKLTEIIPE